MRRACHSKARAMRGFCKYETPNMPAVRTAATAIRMRNSLTLNLRIGGHSMGLGRAELRSGLRPPVDGRKRGGAREPRTQEAPLAGRLLRAPLPQTSPPTRI